MSSVVFEVYLLILLRHDLFNVGAPSQLLEKKKGWKSKGGRGVRGGGGQKRESVGGNCSRP